MTLEALGFWAVKVFLGINLAVFLIRWIASEVHKADLRQIDRDAKR